MRKDTKFEKAPQKFESVRKEENAAQQGECFRSQSQGLLFAAFALACFQKARINNF